VTKGKANSLVATLIVVVVNMKSMNERKSLTEKKAARNLIKFNAREIDREIERKGNE
jgi:hypothetical protein